MPEATQELYGWLSKKWTEHFAQAIDAMCGEHPEFATQPQTLSAEQIAEGSEAILWWRQDFTIAGEARCWIGASDTSWRTIGGQVLKAAGIEDGQAEDIRGTYLEIVNQSLSTLAQSVSARVGREVTCSAGAQVPPESAELYSLEVSFVLGEVECSLLLILSEKFALALQEEPKTETAIAVQAPPPKPAAPGQFRSMELLLDVELPVSVSFGRAQLPLKDVLKLTTGSIIELNRAVSEPVEVIVNNCVIARGEVVVVEGNFGVRIRQVISRQERIRTLK
jgi:flagellar motor switch protein FliN/FliY